METEIIASSPATAIYTVTFVTFALFMAWEAAAPRRRNGSGLVWRWGNNFSLGLLNWYLIATANTALILWLARWTDVEGIGLLAHLAMPHWAGFLLLLASTQLLSYWLHRAFHQVPWLWPIHAVHHSDTEVDVSTSYRHHPLEPLLTLPISLPIVLLLGPSLEAAAAYRVFAVAASVFSHSNVGLPEPIERILRRFLLTPDFHRTHHSAEQRYTNSNYGSLVPWFDYLFGTARHRPHGEQATMPLGLEYLREPTDSRLDRLLMTPLEVPAAAREAETMADAPAQRT
ncbi:sterol desaturase family protein [Pseudohaliea rubra]|uniref:Putative sterol desaturase n=1 Tax=Pseudohaliea rubra DSM 19751 TaxID=1265313 RepID=A0A095VPQ9_9GAMM|nr:sterol desaturase family protein [Pseudohaliea rubra]KGE03073.1 putative sterol desaturase [Pseudohaliea rubra DSM 19751]